MREEAIIMAPPAAAAAWRATILGAWPLLSRMMAERAILSGEDPGELVALYIDGSIPELPELEGARVLARGKMAEALERMGEVFNGFDPAALIATLGAPAPPDCVYLFGIIDRRPGVFIKGLSAAPPASA